MPQPNELIVQIDTGSHVPAYLQIANHLNCIILSGQLSPGSLLPQIRNLAAQLRINPNTVARAYSELAALGRIRKRQGSGCFVAEQLDEARNAESKYIILEGRIDELVAIAVRLGVSSDQLIGMLQTRLSDGHVNPQPQRVRKVERKAKDHKIPAGRPNLWQAADELVD